MSTFTFVLILGAAVLVSSAINQVVSGVATPLIQIGIGVLLAFAGLTTSNFQVDPELFLVLFIAPLLYHEARNTDKVALWSNRAKVLSLAVGLVVVTILCIGFTLHTLEPTIPLAAAFALGAALGPTDAVAVASLSKRVSLKRRQSILLSGESLINDASGVVSFQFSIAALTTGTFSLISATGAFLVSFFGGIGGASKLGVLIKGSNYLETLADVDTVVFDKTGTLTNGTFSVVAVHPEAGHTEQSLLEVAALAESFSDHPIAQSVRVAYQGEVDPKRVSDSANDAGHGVTATIDGKHVVVGNAKMLAAAGVEAPDCKVVGTILHVLVDGVYAGHIVIADTVKADAEQTIRDLHAAGVRRCVMLTGDREEVAAAVAAQLGLDEYHAGLLPGDKVDQIEKLLASKQPKENLAFVGDGVNDAPVLSRADIGIAMGALGSDAAIEAADVVLMDDDPAKIALAMRIARRTNGIVYQNIVFALGVKGICLILGALGIASMWTAIFADVGVMIIAVLNATRALYIKDLAKKNEA